MKKMTMTLFLIATLAGNSFSAKVYSLYSDKRAMQLGDILTIHIVENAKARTNTSTSNSSSSTLNAGGNAGTGMLGFMPSFGVSGSFGSGFDGGGKSDRSGELVAKVSARIDKVLDNGNMLIIGNKVVNINDEEEIIKIVGTVRPQDIEANNIVYSYNIADAKISYSGKGTNSDAQKPGLISSFLSWLF